MTCPVPEPPAKNKHFYCKSNTVRIQKNLKAKIWLVDYEFGRLLETM
jgi:hypothetical protein